MHIMLSSLAALLAVSSSAKSTLAFVAPTPQSITGGCTVARHNMHSPIYARKSKLHSLEDEADNTNAIDPAKKAALEGVLQRIERNYGRGSIVKLGDADRMVVNCIGSGSMTLGEFGVWLLID